MSSQPVLQPSAPEVEGGNPTRERWMELGLVTLVVIVPLFIGSLNLFLFGFPGISSAQSDLKHVTGMISQLAGLALVWYVLRRSRRNFANLGLTWNLGEVGMGLLLALAEIFVTNAARPALEAGYRFWTGEHYHSADVVGYVFAGQIFWTFLLLLVVPFFEEIIVRGYVMTEVVGLTGSMTLAVVVSVFIQGSYHLYQGWLPAVVLSLGCLISAIYYALTKKLLPVIVAHGATDLLALALFVTKH